MHLWWLAVLEKAGLKAAPWTPWTLWSKKSGQLDVATRSSAEYWLSALEISMVAMVWCTLEKIKSEVARAPRIQSAKTIYNFTSRLNIVSLYCNLSSITWNPPWHEGTRKLLRLWVTQLHPNSSSDLLYPEACRGCTPIFYRRAKDLSRNARS